MIEHGVTGFLADVGDVETMARYAIDLLSDESALRAMGKRARASAMEKYCSSKIIPLYEDFYRKVLAQHRRSRHELFGIGQNGQAQADERASAFAVFDHHFGGVAVEHFQALGDVCHADTHASQTIGLLE